MNRRSVLKALFSMPFIGLVRPKRKHSIFWAIRKLWYEPTLPKDIFVTSLSYVMPVDINHTETITMIGNTDYWIDYDLIRRENANI